MTLFLAYSSPWWMTNGVAPARGGSVADLPVTRVAPGPTGQGFTLQLGDDGQVQAQTVILALPRRAIELITPGSVILPDSDVQELVDASCCAGSPSKVSFANSDNQSARRASLDRCRSGSSTTATSRSPTALPCSDWAST